MIETGDSRFKHLELKIGVFVLLALCGCLAVLIFVGAQGDIFTPKYRLHFTASNGAGFNRGMPVKLSGFRIGRVESIELNDQARVDIRLQIDRKYQHWMRKDSLARLAKEGLVGDSIVEIQVGTDGEKVLEDGSEIRFETTKGIEEHVTGLTDQVKPILTEVDQLLVYVNDPNGDIKKTLRNVESMTRDMQKTRAKADQLIDTSRNDLHQITGQVGTLLSRTDESLRTLNATLTRLDHSVAAIDAKLPVILERVDKITADVEKVSQGLTPRVTPLVSRAGSAIDDTGDILRAVKQMWPVRNHLSGDETPRLIKGDSHE